MEKKRKGSVVQSESLSKKPKEDFEKEYECESCQRIIYGGSACVSEHLEGSRHKRLMHIFYLSDYFKQFHINWDVSCPTQYYYQVHEQVLPVDFSVLLKHIEDYHKIEDSSSENNNNLPLILPLVESILKVFKSKVWLVDFPNNNVPLNDYFKTYDVIKRPIRVIEDSPILSFIFELRDNVFSKNDLETITKVASWLEKQGRKFHFLWKQVLSSSSYRKFANSFVGHNY